MLESNVITLDKASHTYRDEHGIEFTSVNRLLKNHGLVWFPPAAEQYLDGAAERGNYVHAACDLVDSGILDWSTVEEKYKGYIESYALYLDEHHPVYLLTESYFCDEEHFIAGTVDRLSSEEQLIVDDLKTSSTLWPHYKWQLAGYSFLVRNSFQLDYLPKRRVIKLKKNGKIASIKWYEDDVDHEVFMACATINRAKRLNKIGG